MEGKKAWFRNSETRLFFFLFPEKIDSLILEQLPHDGGP